MTEAKHTPGPWTEERLYQALNGRATKDEARLIAAAPELLEALSRLSNEVLGSLPLMEPLARREFGNTNYHMLIQRAEEARAAIAKARE